MKKIIFFFILSTSLLLSVAFLNTKNVFAQGTFTCLDTGMGCIVDVNSCDSGFAPGVCTQSTGYCYGGGCVPAAGYCCNSDSDCTGSKVCLSAIGGCNSAGYSGECSNPAPPVANSFWCNNHVGTLNTAIGCIPLFEQSDFFAFFLRWATGIGGGIAFILMLYAGFMIMTAAGNPERLKAGQELLTSAIAGLVLLVFSIFVLKFIGIDILGLCKFGFGPAC